MLFFAKTEECSACGLFGIEHGILSVLTLLGIVIALKYTKINRKEDIKRIILKSTIILWVLEIAKIIFNIWAGNRNNLNTYIPIYYCSILLYAGILSSFCKGRVQRIGDVFIAVGGAIAGIIFIIFPTTSLQIYPMWHFITVQSFFYHGVMIYLAVLINQYHYIELEKKDIIYYASLVIVISLIALFINKLYGSNLMFISQNYPETGIRYLYKLCGKYFTLVMILGQAILPFYISYFLNKRMRNKENLKTE